jgi:hypothetical protein
LIDAYLASLQAHGLLPLASQPRPDPPPVGGVSQQQTDEHYAHAFDGSVARTQLALLDPLGQVPETSATLIQFLSGGGVCLTDVPSGAGAAALSLLCTIAHLRSENILPRTPLRVQLLWGEISLPAQTYAQELISSLLAHLASEAIFVEYQLFSWDVLSAVSNANLVQKIILAQQNAPQTLLIISNFNGFLERSNKKKDAYPQLEELFKYCSGRMNAAIWIEPNMNAAKLSLFPYILDRIKKAAGFVKSAITGDGHQSCNYFFATAIDPSTTVAVRLCVMPLDLARKP